MPHINRIRVNNIKYNFGTQYYDDFLMRFSGKNTIYDLANGGGKSVLMLLLLQNMIPNCTLDEKQPIEKLFRTSNGSTTIHSLVEWKLSDAHIVENYKYMLTGFCARKAKDGEEKEGAAAIEYFNYVIFYREFNDNDIKNLPLSNGKERITYNGLKSYLRELERKDLSLKIHIFERKGEYQRFVANYGIYESEWEIVRGINKTEGHVRTYFESNYKTTRKVVEDLLIEEIIQKSFNARTLSEGQEDVMAKTLMGIKDKLIDLLKSKEDIKNYDRQIELIEGFINRVQSVKELYYGKNNLTKDIKKCYTSVAKAKENCEAKLLGLAGEKQAASDITAIFNREIATAIVDKEEYEMLQIVAKLEEMEKEYEEYVSEGEELGNELLLKENVNNYIDYLYYKKERDELAVLVDNILKDKGELAKELAILAAVKAKRNEDKKNEINAEIDKEKKIIEMESELVDKLFEEKNEINNEKAVFEYLLKDYQNKENELANKMSKKREEYSGILSFDIEKQCALDRKNYEEITAKLDRCGKDIEELRAELDSVKAQKQELLKEIDENDNKLSDNIDERSTLLEKDNKVKKLMQVYGERNVTALKEKLYSQYADVLRQLDAYGVEKNNLKRKYDALSKGCPIIPENEVESVFEYISRYHGDVAIMGGEYIKGLSANDKRDAIERNPILPYAILIKDKYFEIMADTRINEINASGYVVPLIRMELLEKGDYTVDDSKLSFAMMSKELFYDETQIEKQKLKIKEELSAVEFNIAQTEETSVLLKKDMHFVEEYVDVYKEQFEKASALYEELKSIRKEKEASKEEISLKCEQYGKDLEKLLEEYEKIKEQSEHLCYNLSVIELLNNYSNELFDITKKYQETQNLLKNTAVKWDNLEKRLDAEEKQLDKRKNYVTVLKHRIDELDEVWSRDYKLYYKEDISGDSELDDEALEVRFYGLKKAVESEGSDVADKQKLINNYDIAMEKALMAIDYSGMLVQDIKDIYDGGNNDQTSKDDLRIIKKNIENAEKIAKNISAEMTKLRTVRDKKEGSIEHGRKAIEDKYGLYEKIGLNEREFDGFIEAKKAELAVHEAKILKIQKDISDVEKELTNLCILERDVNKIVANGHIDISEEEKGFVDISNIEEKIASIVERNDKFLKAMYDKKEEFEKEKQMLIDTLLKLSAIPLAEEIKRNVVMPEDIAAADKMAEALSEINACIALEKDRVLKSIEDMERIKENFENQCIQTCINIKTELDRLPKLSKIFMDNETISIIGMSIPYVREEQYKVNMEHYINDIIETADTLKKEEDRLKYIKNQLSFKKLFSVIVTDMNAIKLNLYKRERIKEQSRYLRYEEAVGSTGQSQGIYIQFLIAIINYITSINSKTQEGLGLKKAIFIDNPFGAAKDIYIWEPIFKLLKTNNVQLIVPARGTTPAITGRFDVNYILGQKLIDGRAQTVVVDYCSNVDNEQMDYQTLTYEQTTLF